MAADASNPPMGTPAPNAVGHAAPATPANANAVNGQETPQARAVREWLRGQMQQHEASGRAMMIRLRQLHKKDPKLFLQAQHAVGNAIFKYEMEVEE